VKNENLQRFKMINIWDGFQKLLFWRSSKIIFTGWNVVMQMDTYNSNVSRFGVLVSPDLNYEIASNVN